MRADTKVRLLLAVAGFVARFDSQRMHAWEWSNGFYRPQVHRFEDGMFTIAFGPWAFTRGYPR